MSLCAFLLAAVMGSNSSIVLNQLREFNARNFDVLFSKYFSPDLEVFQHPDFSELRRLIRTLDLKIPDDAKREAIENSIHGYDQNIFPDLEVLKGHVRKQFASPQEMHIDVLEHSAFGNYVITVERKKRDGIIVDAVDIYYIENGMIRKMWIAKAEN